MTTTTTDTTERVFCGAKHPTKNIECGCYVGHPTPHTNVNQNVPRDQRVVWANTDCPLAPELAAFVLELTEGDDDVPAGDASISRSITITMNDAEWAILSDELTRRSTKLYERQARTSVALDLEDIIGVLDEATVQIDSARKADLPAAADEQWVAIDTSGQQAFGPFASRDEAASYALALDDPDGLAEDVGAGLDFEVLVQDLMECGWAFTPLQLPPVESFR